MFVAKKKYSLGKKIALFFAIIITLIPVVFSLGYGIKLLLLKGGVLPTLVPVSGSSMLPTITDNTNVALKAYPGFPFLNHTIRKRDLVVFENEKTIEEIKKQHKEGGGFVKRVIATEGDSIVIKNGYVYVNGIPLVEQYILKPRSTFGTEKLPDCKEVKVPKDYIFVLGDNRKRSEDSRHIDFVSLKDVEYYLPFSQQAAFQPLWHTAIGNASSTTSFLDVHEYVRLLNEKRREYGLKPLDYQEKLSLSAEKRAKAMLNFNDLSFEATKSGYTMNKSMQEVGYSNIVYGELPTLGYYDAQELVDYFFEFAKSREFLLDKTYQEIGISTFVGSLAGCPTQIVVQHIAGYIPPNYPADTIQGWKVVLDKLKQIQPGWQDVKKQATFYQQNRDDVDDINDIIEKRINRIASIVSRMEKNEWLTKEEQDWATKDGPLHNQQQLLANKLNEKGK